MKETILSFIFLRRRSSTAAPKSTPTASTTSTGKKSVAPPPATNNTVPKSGIKSPDKAPLLEQTNAPAATKRKLVPERTVQISDVNTSRFKSTSGTATTTAGQTSTTGKDTSSGSAETAAATSSAPSAIKPVLTAADSGIYGADLSDDVPPVTKPISAVEPPVIKPVPTVEPLTTKSVTTVEPPKIYGIDLPDKSEPTPPIPPVTVVVNPLSESSTPTPTHAENTTVSAIVVPNNVSINSTPDEKEVLLPSILKEPRLLDETVRSAYSNLIDATMSENEGAIGGGSIASSASQSRRTSNVKQPLLSHETNNIDTISRKTTPFNPLHMILKKDANKYYTTEYI